MRASSVERSRVHRVLCRIAACAALVSLLGGCGGEEETEPDASSSDANAETSAKVEPSIELVEVGSPIWEPTGFRVFSGPIGVEAEGFAQIPTTVECMLTPENHVLIGNNFVPVMPHPAPHATEFVEGAERCGYVHRGRFTVAEFSEPNGIFTAFMLVPRPDVAPVGRSGVFESGPIMPHDIFPIAVEGDVLHNGEVADPNVANVAQPLSELVDPEGNPYDVDGYSHVPFVWIDWDIFHEHHELAGTYTHVHSYRDSTGAGWDIRLAFEVE